MKSPVPKDLEKFLEELRSLQVRGERNGAREISDMLLHVLSAGRGDWRPLNESLGIL